MFGILEQAGICKEVATLAGEVRAPSREENLAHNAGLLQSLGEDSHADELAKLTRADAELGRMTTPMPGMLLIPEHPPPPSVLSTCVFRVQHMNAICWHCGYTRASPQCRASGGKPCE